MKRGIILIEALLAVLVLVMGFLALYQLVAPSLRHRNAAQQSIAGAQLAKDIMATLRAQSLESSHAGNWMDFWTDFSAGDRTLCLNGETDTNNAVIANALLTNRTAALRPELPPSPPQRYIVHVPLIVTNPMPVLVQVWQGETGLISSSNAFSLYAEFDDPGGL